MNTRSGASRGANAGSKQQLILLAVIVTTFVVMQLINFGVRWVDDESWYLMPLPSIHQAGEFRIPSIPGQDVFWAQTPLLTYLEFILDYLSPLTAKSARAIPLAFGIGLIFGAYLLGSSLFNPRVGVLAAAFTAADNLIFLASRTVRPEILVTAFSVFALWAAVKALGSAKRTLWLFASAVFCGLAAASHPNGLMVAPIVGILILIVGENSLKTWRTVTVFGVIAAVAIAPVFIWLIAFDWSNDMINFKTAWLGRYGRNGEEGVRQSFTAWSLIKAEINGRYFDFLQLPYRLHIGISVVLTFLLMVFSRSRKMLALSAIFLFELAFFIFVNNSNPSVRYLTIPMPIIALGLSALLIAWYDEGIQRNLTKQVVAAMLVLSLGLSSLAGNAILLWKFRDADYQTLTEELRAVLPKDASVYGGLFLWLALRDTKFTPYIRTPWKKALATVQPNVVILDDWVMKGGGDNGTWTALTKEIDEYVAVHGTLVKTIDAGFYGKLRVFHLK